MPRSKLRLVNYVRCPPEFRVCFSILRRVQSRRMPSVAIRLSIYRYFLNARLKVCSIACLESDRFVCPDHTVNSQVRRGSIRPKCVRLVKRVPRNSFIVSSISEAIVTFRGLAAYLIPCGGEARKYILKICTRFRRIHLFWPIPTKLASLAHTELRVDP